MAGAKSISVLLVEDSALFRAALTNVFARNEALNLAVCPSNAFLRKKGRVNEEVVIIDAVTWASGLQSMVEAVEITSKAAPVLLLGRDDLLQAHVEAVRAGAVGYLKQTAPAEVVIKAIKGAARGGVCFEQSLLRKVFIQTSLEEKVRERRQLNQNEQRILALIASGRTNKEIAADLGFTERTIKAYVSNLLRKIGVHNRSALTSYAMTHGLTTCANVG